MKNQMDLQFFFFEITYGCNINREQEQILMFKLYLKFPGTAEKQSQRERPEVAEAPLGLLWGRRLSAATEVPHPNQGGTAARSTDFSLWAALSTSFASSNLAQNLQNLTDKRGGRAVAGEDTGTATSPKPPWVTPATSMPAAPKRTRLQIPASEQRRASTPCMFLTAIYLEHLAKNMDTEQEHLQNHTAQPQTGHTEPWDTLVFSCHPSPRGAGALPPVQAAHGRL